MVTESLHDPALPLLAHLRELRRRAVWSGAGLALALVTAYLCYDLYIGVVLAPLQQKLQMYTHDVPEAFAVKLQVTWYVGLCASLPLHLYQVVRFVQPALDMRQFRWLLAGVAASAVLVLLGALMAYSYVVPLSVDFLMSEAFRPDKVSDQHNFHRNLLFVFKLILAFVVLFQLPLVLLLCMRLGLFDRHLLWRGGRYAVVLIFALSAIVPKRLLTPPKGSDAQRPFCGPGTGTRPAASSSMISPKRAAVRSS